MILVRICILLMLLLTWIVAAEAYRHKKHKESAEVALRIKTKQAERLQTQLIEKVKTKIEFSERSRTMRKNKDELIAKYIYKQDYVQELGDEFAAIHAQEYQMLRQHYPQLTSLDLLILSLLNIEMTNAEICELLRMERRTLYRRRQLIAQRIGISSGILEDFVREVF